MKYICELYVICDMYDLGCFWIIYWDPSWYSTDYRVYMGSSMIVRPLAGCHCTCVLINWSVLRHMVYWIVLNMGCMSMSIRGPLPLLIYSGGVGLQGKYSIWYNTIACSARRVGRARLDLVGWATSDGAAHVLSCGYWGSYPHNISSW